jgi:hypothetical protein
MTRPSTHNTLVWFVITFLLVLSAAACGNAGTPTATEPATTPAATGIPPIQPTSSPTPERTAELVSVVVGLNNDEDWRPPTVEDTKRPSSRRWAPPPPSRR